MINTTDRPSWCPHPDCLFRCQVAEGVCGGEPSDRNERYRICMARMNRDGGLLTLYPDDLDEGDFEAFFVALAEGAKVAVYDE